MLKQLNFSMLNKTGHETPNAKSEAVVKEQALMAFERFEKEVKRCSRYLVKRL